MFDIQLHVHSATRKIICTSFIALLSVGCSNKTAPTSLPSTAILTTLPSPMVEKLNEELLQDCRPIDSVELTLELNALHQVMISWDVQGGCAPFQAVLTAWYQDETAPYAQYPISTPNGQLLDIPVLHRGVWDIDYILEVSDAGGHSARTVQTIGVGR